MLNVKFFNEKFIQEPKDEVKRAESAGRGNAVVVADLEAVDGDFVKWVTNGKDNDVHEHKKILFPSEKMQKYFDS